MSCLDLVDGRRAGRASRRRGRRPPARAARACRDRTRARATRSCAEYSRISSAAICRTALRARPLVLAQSAPPSRCRLGASPPEYLVTSSSWSVGTYSRSGGWPRLLGAYSMTRYSRVAPWPRCGWSSPGTGRRRAARAPRSRPGCSCSGSMPPRRLLGIRCVSRAPVRWPARSLSVSTASLAAGQLKPWPIRPVATYGTPGSGGSSRSASRAPRPSPAQQLGEPLRRAVALGDQ